MTTITITIPDNITERVIDALSYRFNYSDTLEDGSPNPEGKGQFVKRKIVEYLKQSVKQAEVEIAKNDAAAIAGQSADTDIVIS